MSDSKQLKPSNCGEISNRRCIIPQTTLDEDEIINACDYPGEAAAAIAAHRGCSLEEAFLIVERAMSA